VTDETERARVLSRSWDLYHAIKAGGGLLPAESAARLCGPLAERVFVLGITSGWLIFDTDGVLPGFRIVDNKHPLSNERLPPHVQRMIDESAQHLAAELRSEGPQGEPKGLRARLGRFGRGLRGALVGGAAGALLGAWVFGRRRVGRVGVRPSVVSALTFGVARCDCGAVVIHARNARTGAPFAYLHMGGEDHGGGGGGEELEDEGKDGVDEDSVHGVGESAEVAVAASLAEYIRRSAAEA